MPGPGWTPELAQSVLTDLRAEVRHHGLDICEADRERASAPMVTLEIEARQASAMRMSLDIVDPATGRRPARELRLDSMPPDGHSLAVAVAADELLTSSWIKLTSRTPVETTAPPKPAAAIPSSPPVAPTLQPPLPRRHELALLAATERFGGSPWSFGSDVAFRRWLLPRWAVELAAGARTRVEETAPHGQVRSRVFPLSLRLLAGALPFPAQIRTGAAAALVALPLFVDGEPIAGATSASRGGLALYLRGELWADVRVSRFRVRASGGAGLPLRGVAGDDTGVAVGGARGLSLHAQLGLGLEL